MVKLLDRLGIKRYMAGLSWGRSGLNGAVAGTPLCKGDSVAIAGETNGAGQLAGGRRPSGCNGYTNCWLLQCRPAPDWARKEVNQNRIINLYNTHFLCD
jgi:hypothetical protein